MYKVIVENNRVNYGCIDEPIEWNYDEFKLLDFFNKEIKGFKKKFAYHQFNYVGITAGKYIVGLLREMAKTGKDIKIENIPNAETIAAMKDAENGNVLKVKEAVY